jgi:hypothetical protein
MHLCHRYQYQILDFLAGALIDSLISAEASVLAAACLVAFLAGFLRFRRRSRGPHD